MSQQALRLPDAVDGPVARDGLGASALFRASVRQDIRTVPIYDNCLILVVEGVKEIGIDNHVVRVPTGGAIALRAGLQIDSGNQPDPRTGRYRALVLAFAPALIEAFAQHYPGLVGRGDGEASRVLAASDAPAVAALHAADGLARDELSPEIARHRLFEVLLALGERGVRWPLPGHETAAQRLRLLLGARPSTPWTSLDAARLLGISEPTLRRRLAAEGTSFRDLLAEVRLSHGLTLLLTSRTGIAEIALACGYESPSRFARRFRIRFGTTPSELRGERKGAEVERDGRAT